VEAGETWDAILSDVMMPGIDGVEFARRAVATKSELRGRIILMTGGVAIQKLRTAVEESGLPVIAKPVDLPALRLLLATVHCRSG
jgi:CheY-like chemotaxis protein